LDWVDQSSGGGDANTNSFKFIARSGTGSGSTITAQNDEDTITFVAGSNMTINHGGTGANPTIEFVASGSTGVTSIATTSPILGGTITGTGTITHSNASGNRHIPTGGSGSSGSRQVLTYNGVDGTATFQNASEHGSHSGGGFTYWEESNTSLVPTVSGGYALGTSSRPINWINLKNATGIKVNGVSIWETHGHHEFKKDVYIKNPNILYTEKGNRSNDGSESAPGYAFSGGTQNFGTGMWYSSSTLNFSAAGTREMSIGTASTFLYGYLNIGSMTSGGYNRVTMKWSTSDGYVYYDSSTAKVKMNIEPLTIDTSKIYDLDLRSFNYKKVTYEGKVATYIDEPGAKSFGMIAEEVYDILPELVALDSEGEPLAIDYDRISVLILAELKKLRDRIEVLEGN